MPMQPKEHANLLSIFAFVFAGIQGLIFLFIALYVLLMGGMMIAGALNSTRSDAAGMVIWIMLILLFAALASIGLTTVISNIRLGKKLRSGFPPTKRFLVVTSILNICSFLCGGMLVLPFGTALGIYGLWFANSDVGKVYLSGNTENRFSALPPSSQTYDSDHGFKPYRWQ